MLQYYMYHESRVDKVIEYLRENPDEIEEFFEKAPYGVAFEGEYLTDSDIHRIKNTLKG